MPQGEVALVCEDDFNLRFLFNNFPNIVLFLFPENKDDNKDGKLTGDEFTYALYTG